MAPGIGYEEALLRQNLLTGYTLGSALEAYATFWMLCVCVGLGGRSNLFSSPFLAWFEWVVCGFSGSRGGRQGCLGSGSGSCAVTRLACPGAYLLDRYTLV